MEHKNILLIKNGKAFAHIIHSPDIAGDIAKAAQDLAIYLEKSTGILLEIKSPSEAGADSAEIEFVTIHVGADDYVRRIVPDFQQLSDDGFVIITVDPSNLIIAGTTSRGTGYGVSHFLETFVGVRWLMPGPDGEVVPALRIVEVPAIHLREEPVFQSRTQPGAITEVHREWGRRMRLHEALCGATHALQAIFAPEKYAESNPEFYPVIDGKRALNPRRWGWHPCFNAEGLAEEAGRIILNHFRTHPEERCFAISISDGAMHCECEKCRADEKGRLNTIGMRHVSDHYFRWANEVAELVCAEFPDHLLGTLGYANLYDPPVEVKIHSNIVVFNTYDRHKWIDSELEREGYNITEAWSKSGAVIGWYDYTFGSSFLVPRIYSHQMQENLSFAQEAGVAAIAAETCHNWAEAPKYYLMARLQWNPNLDVDALLDEWYFLAVGADAAPYIKEYFSLWERIWTRDILKSASFSRKAQQWLPIQDDSYFDVLNTSHFTESRKLLEQVLGAVETEGQKQRAKMLIDGFSFYEATAEARLADWRAGSMDIRNAEEAVAMIETAVSAMKSAVRALSIDLELSKHEVMQRVVVDYWAGVKPWGWGSYPLWRACDWVTQDTVVRSMVERLTADMGRTGAHARALLSIVDRNIDPIIDMPIGTDSIIVVRNAGDVQRLCKEPGDNLEFGRWCFTVGDDVTPFWNKPHIGRVGEIHVDPDGGKQGRGAFCCIGTDFGTLRWKMKPFFGSAVVICYVRVKRLTRGRINLNLWEIDWADHNPSPYHTIVSPQPGIWTPVAVPIDLRMYPIRYVDYLLLEIEMDGFEAGVEVEIADVAVWPLPINDN
jgi:hypothetical protein